MKCKNCGKEVDEKTVFCPFCHLNTFNNEKKEARFLNSSSKTIARGKFSDVRKVTLFAMSIIVLIFVAILLWNILAAKNLPYGMPEQTYNAGVQVVEITDKYLNFEISKDDAKRQISEIADRIGNNNNSADLGISIYVNSISWELTSPSNSDDEILESRNKLASELNLPEK